MQIDHAKVYMDETEDLATEYRASYARRDPSIVFPETEAAGFKIDEVVADDGVSGITTRLAHRPQGRRLWDMPRKGDTLVARWVDRLGRKI